MTVAQTDLFDAEYAKDYQSGYWAMFAAHQAYNSSIHKAGITTAEKSADHEALFKALTEVNEQEARAVAATDARVNAFIQLHHLKENNVV